MDPRTDSRATTIDQAARVSLVIPTLNEAENVDSLLEAVFEAAQRDELALEVIVVDDGSSDGTRDLVRAWTATHPVRLLCRDTERGLAGAVLAGARSARGDVVVVMDADLSHPPAKVPVLAKLVLDGEADMAIGSRYIKEGRIEGWPFVRRIVSKGAVLLAAPFTDTEDPMSGFFAIRRTLLLESGQRGTGFKIALEVLAHGPSDLRVVEVPITFRDRTRGASKLGASTMSDYLLQLGRFGGFVSELPALRLAVATLLMVCVDFMVFGALFSAGVSLGAAHIASFSIAAAAGYWLNFRWAFRREAAATRAESVGRRKSFVLIACLALFLQGGVLGALIHTLGWSPLIAIGPAILAAAAVQYLGCAFFVFSRERAGKGANTGWRLAFIGIAAYLLALRMAYAGSIYLLPQEAYYWNYSEHLDIGYLDHPPMVAWLIHVGTALLGQTELGVRIGAVLISLITSGFAYLLARNLFGRGPGYVAALLATTLPFFFGTGLVMTPDVPLVACWAGALYFLERALLAEQRAAWWGAGICVGLGMLSKYTMVLVPLSTLVYCLVDRRARRSLAKPEPYGAALVALLLFTPVLLWNVRNGWASFVYQGPRRWNAALDFNLHTLVWQALLLITPLGAWAFIRGLRRVESARRFGIVFTVVPLAVFVTMSLRDATKLNWTGPIWLAALPFIAASMGSHATDFSSLLSRAWKPSLIALLVGYGLFLHFASIGVPGVTHPKGKAFMDWRELGAWVERIELDLEQRTGAEPLVVGMDRYNLASLLAFYDPNFDGADETAAQGMFGEKGLMYDRWFPTADQDGKSLVLVSDEARELESPGLLARVQSLEPIQKHTVTRDGVAVGTYYARVAYGYGPPRMLDVRQN
jgi:dolichol-phosphate mannosyltransferase